MGIKEIFNSIVRLVQTIMDNSFVKIVCFYLTMYEIYEGLKRMRAPIKKKLNWSRIFLINLFNLKIPNPKFVLMNKSEKYSYLKITPSQLVERIQNSGGWAFHFNTFIEGSIIRVPVGLINGKTIYQQFERFKNQFRDLGLCSI